LDIMKVPRLSFPIAVGIIISGVKLGHEFAVVVCVNLRHRCEDVSIRQLV